MSYTLASEWSLVWWARVADYAPSPPSSTCLLPTVSHYFDSDPTKLVQSLRNDGKMPNAYIADTTTANAQVYGHRG